ncbi:hypothetical protein SODALDRAFT_331321 [Sodiomyces alkalinus F11]|uniref:Uncharacterized protein n=1 Tax=Sodiomyces alkalinus (strain CBS 110278 / VKM F-3762 / F11) TaxID=1314773 RepID=A0A3N2Q481_SODAK|nr:hypothetical protein SODALDRAFT_331321 [Sodiomyces alkalinus F11]ROT41573.1 hypothetical protein SODALDRAFT_331321 [Sodiomyces alkalinus F11]
MPSSSPAAVDMVIPPKTSSLQPFMVLCVAPFLGYRDIQALRCVCTEWRRILDQYERSVSLRHSGLREYEVQPRHLILGSETPTRYVIPFPSYPGIRELEERARQIQYVVHQTNYLKDGFSCIGLGDCAPEELSRATQGIERALWLCSDIADLEAAPWASFKDVPENLRVHRHLVGHGREDREQASDATTTKEDRVSEKPVRVTQLELLENLPTVDLARLVVLLFLTRHAFMEFVCGEAPRDFQNPLYAEWCMSVVEATLRHGVFFLHAQIQGGNEHLLGRAGVGSPLARRAAEIATDLVEEIRLWEKSWQNMLPGLNMTVQGTFRRRIGCDPRQSLYFAAEMIKGNNVTCGNCKTVIADAGHNS